MSGMSLQQNLSLGQTLSPQMQQSLQFLQAPVLELQTLIQQELQINPVLEEAGAESEHESDSAEAEDWDQQLEQLRKRDEEWREYFSQNNSTSTPYDPEAAERRQFLFDSQVEAPKLSDHLQQQLNVATSHPDTLRAGQEIIGNLDENGYLQVPLIEIAQAAHVDYTIAQRALALIQSFDPIGVAAADLRDCLLIQLRRLGKEREVEMAVVSQYFSDLGRRKHQEIAKALKIPLERVQQAADFISTLQPRPGSTFSSDLRQNVVQAELAIERDTDGNWIVIMNDDPVPRLRISDTYKDLLASGNGHDPSIKDYLKDRIRSGKFLIKCLHQRQQTIQNIANEIVKRQTAFFEHGTSHLKPLTMSQVADVVGVHETTVSRALANKYVQTPHGLFELKYFFTPGYQTASGEVMSNTSVKDSIAELVNRESAHKPLSDQEMVKILSERGIPLARRTVAKYRAELNILPSNLRKRS